MDPLPSDTLPQSCSVAMLILFAVNACVLAVIELGISRDPSVALALRDPPGDSKKKKMAKPLAPTLRSVRDLCREIAWFSAIMGVAWIAEFHPVFPHSQKVWDRDLYWFLCLILMVFAFRDVKTLKEHQRDVLNREQSEEWKGWMQFMFLLYHYYKAEEVYNSIRVMITCYVWMTGFGNFSFFYIKRDFGLVRVLQMLWRLNFLVVVLCMVMGNTYVLYYICPLHTFFFLMVYVTMRVMPSLNHSRWGIKAKLLVLGAVIFIMWDLPEICGFKLTFGAFLPTIPVIGATGGTLWEWYFRTSLDHWSTYLGMIFALNFPMMQLWFTKVEALPPLHHMLIKGVAALLLSFVGLYWVYYYLPLAKLEYNQSNPYMAFVPLLVYVYLRNMTPWLRSVYLGPLHSIGKTTLETYLMQHHIWLTSNAKTLVTIIPGYPKLNFVLASILFVVLSQELYRLTMTLRGMLMPDDKRACVTNLCIIGGSLLGAWAVAAAIVVASTGGDGGLNEGTFTFLLTVVVIGTTVGVLSCIKRALVTSRASGDKSGHNSDQEQTSHLLGEGSKGKGDDTLATTAESGGVGSGGVGGSVSSGGDGDGGGGGDGDDDGGVGGMTASKVLNPGVLTSGVLVTLFVVLLRTSLWYTNTHVGERFFSANLVKAHKAATAAAASGVSAGSEGSPSAPQVTASDFAAGCAELANNGYWTSSPACDSITSLAACHSDGWAWSETPKPHVQGKLCPTFSRLSALEAFKLLNGKSITFFGDSVARNLYYSYARALGDATTSGHNGTAPKHADIHATFTSPDLSTSASVQRSTSSNGQLAFLWAPYTANATARVRAMANRLQSTAVRTEHVVVLSTGLWDALNVRSEARFGADLAELSKAVGELKFAATSKGAPPASVIWLKTTHVVDLRLQAQDKRTYMNDAIMDRYRGVEHMGKVEEAVDAFLDGAAITDGQDALSYDGVHYDDVIYDTLTQISLNQLRSRWTILSESAGSGAAAASPSGTPKSGNGHEVCEMNHPGYALWVLGVVVVMMLAMDNFFGIPMVVSHLLGGDALKCALTYENAYGPLLVKIGMRPAPSQGASDA